MAPLLSDGYYFYPGAAMTCLLCSGVALEILCGWIHGHRLRSKLLYVLVLVYGAQLGQDALKLRTFLANIPESRRVRCPSAGEYILMEGAYVHDLLQFATSSFNVTMAVVVLVICKKQGRPRRPRAPGWRGAGTVFVEAILFALCILTCAYSVPALVLDYVAATASRSSS